MCGIFGIISKNNVRSDELFDLSRYAEQRGRDSSGLLVGEAGNYRIYRSSTPITSLLKRVSIGSSKVVIGHSRLITNGLTDNQPVYRDGVCVIHNGIIVNSDSLWRKIEKQPKQEIDTEIIPAIIRKGLEDGNTLIQACQLVLDLCEGIVACAIALPQVGKLCLLSNNGSLYIGQKEAAIWFSSEKFPLVQSGCSNVRQINQKIVIFEMPISSDDPAIQNEASCATNLIPKLGVSISEEKLLEFNQPSLRRCTRCILPETMPFIRYDQSGVCNYCYNYKLRNRPKPISQLLELLKAYRRNGQEECIVPFSGGRDSCFALHLIVNELNLKPITYTYDWGMVTDLGRRNISRMCAKLGVENIIVADNIVKKRQNIAKNFTAWLRAPHLGMVSILTAGDKHFFRHVETVKKQTGISLNLWGVNPLEVTHFKAGFLGVPPDFEEERVYSNGIMKQFRYQFLRLQAMLASPSYFNASIWDTISGEYYRSFTNKSDYFHIFDYWRWDEDIINNTLLKEYDWELAPDTNTTWRIGDGTAAIYNYIYYTVAGFTEHDTFRSNQIREGDITRERALELVNDENRPRYPNIKWYLDAVGLDFRSVISVINRMPKKYGI
jgi:glucosamine--fructose-6-phosphate aminotransferase (isomerizing)